MPPLSQAKKHLLLAVATGCFLQIAPSANAQLIVYEGFQYEEVGDELIGKPDEDGGVDAIGLTDTWVDAAATNGVVNDMFLKSGSLVFGDLATSGNHIGFLSNANNDIYSRPLTTEAAADITAASEIWFSVLFEKLQNNFSAGEGGFALTNQTVGTPRIYLNDGTDGLAGFGFGPTTDGNDLKPYAWDGTTQIAGDMEISVPPANGNSNTADSNFGDVRLLVGQISFDTGAEGADQYTLYDYQLVDGSVAAGGLGTAIATTIEIDVDQSTIGILNLTRQVNVNWDEVRIGTTLASVLEAPPGPAFTIRSIDYDSGTAMLTLTWDSSPEEMFIVKYSRDLADFSGPQDGDLEDGIPADAGDTTTKTFDLSVAGLDDEGRVYFRVERQVNN